MKDSEFIELLNLYLDHEISAPDAARLEAEVHANPGRRKIYQQYCRMQKASKLLAVDFCNEAASPAETKAVRFNPTVPKAAAASRQRSFPGYLTAGAMAAAACVALLLVRRDRTSADAPVFVGAPQQVAPSPAMESPAVAINPPVVQVGIASAPSPGVQNRRIPATLVADPLLLTGSAQNEAMLVVASPQATDQLAWVQAFQLSPLPQRVPAEQLRFGTAPANLRPEGRPLGGTRAPTQAEIEMTAFRFLK